MHVSLLSFLNIDQILVSSEYNLKQFIILPIVTQENLLQEIVLSKSKDLERCAE